MTDKEEFGKAIQRTADAWKGSGFKLNYFKIVAENKEGKKWTTVFDEKTALTEEEYLKKVKEGIITDQ